MVSFIDALGIEKTNIFGQGSGGHFAIEVAAAYPERVDKLVLLGISLREAEDWQAGERPHDVSKVMDSLQLKEDGQVIMHKWNRCKRMIPKATPLQVLKVFIPGMERMARYIDPREYYGHEAAHFYYSIKSRLGMIQSPTLLIIGDQDPLYNDLDYTKSLIPRCRTEVIEGEGILPHIGKPEEFTQAIIDFLKNPEV